MPNLNVNKTPMAVRDPLERGRDFGEVAQGYTAQQAMEEAARCLQCKHKPCTGGCPVQVDIPAFIRLVAEGDFAGAYEVIARASSLPAVCGRVCPQENQCEKHCVRGVKGEPVAIGRLERFVADWHNSQPIHPAQPVPSNGHRAAVIGSGPAGLACAGELLKKGCDVTLFEALHTPGGVLVYGIPEFRLPKKIVEQEIALLKSRGLKVMTNMVIGKVLSIDDLLDEQGFDAVFVGTGAGLPRFMNIPGENLGGVYSANEFLTRVNLMKAYLPNSVTPIRCGKRVVVVGGGNVAMDAARCALRLGAQEVSVVYRRSAEELPARAEEVEHAMEEGIRFCFLTNPVEILGDENRLVTGIRCVEMELGEPDTSGRRRPVEKTDSDFILRADTVIMAIGTSPNPLIKSTTEGLETQRWGGIVADEWGATSRQGVFAGGDAVTGAATVILAMGAGKKAAAAMDEYMRSKT
ncbi:MAG: NADPH-dependent glutamate synthase [Ruminococcaceae bacterium]|nr:NADPH-dependent glutamate synthase [Oscillospiraceae bacterium]